jgi:hypothetical protein
VNGSTYLGTIVMLAIYLQERLMLWSINTTAGGHGRTSKVSIPPGQMQEFGSYNYQVPHFFLSH